ncbi:AMP-binding protein [Photorhabdus temperata]|uniref:Non-ribosomal peptide synthase n=1 Tax=Photorhabdus temperata subsp. temperata Meg1 TaxID=1393735 RepID=A0A081RZJ9_PHOTE|nr:AMP-binding protein [Photorhabdus temperata]KER04102.1 non-ribosomal peptide synthase [Photorhabdus temperata subsp. temperata Meg1]MCT8349350.1 AMP-binding protein [Photorhabdus temperata]
MTLFKKNTNVVDYLYAASSKHPCSEFLRDYPYGITYRHFLNRVEELVNSFKNIISCKVIAISMNKSVDFYACLAMSWKLNKIVVPINKSWSKDRIHSILKSSGTGVFISDECQHLENEINIFSSIFINFYPRESANTLEKDNIAYILYTSGTTGLPKGVPISHNSLCSYIKGISKIIQFNPYKDCLTNIFEPNFDLFFHDLLLAWYYSCPLTPINVNQPFSILKKIKENRVTCWFSVPSLIPLIKLTCKELTHLNNIRISLFCGEPLLLEDCKTWSELTNSKEIFNLYGPTEATIACYIHQLTQSELNGSGSGYVKIGRPIGDTTEHLNKLNSNLYELTIGGPQVFSGYISSDKECFIKSGSSIYYKTGDLVSVDCNGNLEFKGRTDRQVKILGKRIELESIERDLRDLNRNSNIFIKPYFDTNKKICTGVSIYYKEIQGKSLVTAHCELLNDLTIKMVKKINSIPRNSNGKVDYHEFN